MVDDVKRGGQKRQGLSISIKEALHDKISGDEVRPGAWEGRPAANQEEGEAHG